MGVVVLYDGVLLVLLLVMEFVGNVMGVSGFEGLWCFGFGLGWVCAHVSL